MKKALKVVLCVLGAVVALAALGIGWCAMIVAMIFWNWIVTPLYMHVSRSSK